MCQHTKLSQKKGKLPAKLAEEAPWNKLYVDIIGPYKISRKEKQTLLLKAVTIVNPVTGWFEITQYVDKKEITIANLAETTWLVRYLWPLEIMYYQVG